MYGMFKGDEKHLVKSKTFRSTDSKRNFPLKSIWTHRAKKMCMHLDTIDLFAFQSTHFEQTLRWDRHIA